MFSKHLLTFSLQINGTFSLISGQMMHTAAAHRSLYVVQHSELRDFIAKPYSGWQASAPVLMTLALVSILGSLLAAIAIPAALNSAVMAMAILVVCASCFAFISIFASGEIIEARFEKSTQSARLLYRGPVAHTDWVVPFHQISGARMAMRYDEIGRKISAPMLDLVNGGQIALPQSTTWSDIEAIRDMTAGAVDAVAEAWARKSSNSAVVRHGRRQ